MKRPLIQSIFALLFFTWAASRAPADLLTPGMEVTDTIGQINSLETKNGFSAQFWVTTDEQVFLTWAKNSSIRNLKPTIEVKRNTPIYLALFLANPGVKSVTSPINGKVSNLSDVTFDLYIVSPDGTLSVASKQRGAWKGAPPSPGLVTLAKDRGVLNFEAIDPLGEYTIVLVVRDNVRKVDMKLTRKFQLVE